MGAGKSTAGALLARRLGWRFVDADDVFVQHTGMPIAEFMAARGEPHFRVVEREILAELLEPGPPIVLATGGGAVLDERNRALMRSRALVVWLDAPAEVLVARVGDDPDRPLLAGDAARRLVELSARRRPAYEAAAHHRVDAASVVPEQVAERVAQLVHRPGAPFRQVVHVPLGERAYDVVVGPGALDSLASLLPAGVRRVALVSQPSIPVEVDAGVPTTRYDIGDGEAAKTVATVETLCRAWARDGLTRADAVVAVGGGVVTDTAGFAAAVYHRGLPVVHVPTTLLGQVDAAIGGKTGVNIAEGKNLIGAFWQPAGVVCDTDTLVTLPAREFRCGLGELAKYHFIGGEHLHRLPLPERVAAAVAIKAEVVAGDEREGGRRAILNYGHTLAHALETAGRYDLRHGEAVAIGLVFAAELAYRLGRIDAARVLDHRRVVADYDLDDRLPAGSDRDELIELMGRDKKATAGLTFVLDGPAGVEAVTGVDRVDLDATFDAVGVETERGERVR